MRLKLLVKQGHPEGISTQFLEIDYFFLGGAGTGPGKGLRSEAGPE